MFAHDFVREAYIAGTPIALACGLIGWFVVLRAQVFAGDALSHVAFVGAIAAAAAGVDERVGLFAFTFVVALGMAALGGRSGEADDSVIGMVFAWVLGVGVLLLAVLATTPGGSNGVTLATTLFGSIFSLTSGQALLAAVVALVVAAALGAIARPLLLATLDGELATLRRVPVGVLGAGFLALLAAVAAETTQAVGALLLLGLLAAPAGAAHLLTARPFRGLAISAAIAVASMWAGLALAYAVPSLPPSSAIIAFAAASYAGAAIWRWAQGVRSVRRPVGTSAGAFLRSSR
jgi:zinc/manganese transport system permease protein